MSDETLRERFRQNASGIAATTVTGTWLAALMLGFDWWLGAMLFGYVVVVPVVSMLFDDDEDWAGWDPTARTDGEPQSTTADRERSTDRSPEPREGVDTADALERLRTRYANGDLTDEQFERKVDRLLETETPEDAAEWVARNRATEPERAPESAGESGADRGGERDRDLERER
jgi:uncharacterized membrane protein